MYRIVHIPTSDIFAEGSEVDIYRLYNLLQSIPLYLPHNIYELSTHWEAIIAKTLYKHINTNTFIRSDITWQLLGDAVERHEFDSYCTDDDVGGI